MQTMSKCITSLVIDLAKFEKYRKVEHPNEEIFLTALAENSFPLLRKLTLINFNFKFEISNFQFMNSITDFSIQGNQIEKIYELPLVKFMGNAHNLKHISITDLSEINGCFLLPLIPNTMLSIKMRNVSLQTGRYIYSFLLHQDTLELFEYTIYNESSGWKMPYKYADEMLTHVPSTTKTIKILLSGGLNIALADNLLRFPNLQDLKLIYNPLYIIETDMNNLQFMPSLKRLSIHESTPHNLIDFSNHTHIYTNLRLCKQLSLLKMNITNMLAVTIISLKREIPLTTIAFAYKTVEYKSYYSFIA